MSSKAPKKLRLDELLVSRGLFLTTEMAQAHILAGEIWSQQTRLEKAGQMVALDTLIEVKSPHLKFVSRAGFKLEHALEHFQISMTDRVALDVGASTGGFTDCMLQRGAKHVFAIDVGTAQLHERLKKDSRVTTMENLNARALNGQILVSSNGAYCSKDIDFVCADVSFISLGKIAPSVKLAAPAAREWLLLFKPQFEVPREAVSTGGIVRDASATQTALAEFITSMAALGLGLISPAVESPLAGKKSGNVEILLHFGVEQ